MASSFKQEMPPKGGFNPIIFTKRYTRPLNGYKSFAVFGAVTGCAWIYYKVKKKSFVLEKAEMNDARFAVLPLVLAEAHRCQLKQFRKNRDEEAELMKDVEDWETGTLFGTPVFYNTKDTMPSVSSAEYFAHKSHKVVKAREYISWSTRI